MHEIFTGQEIRTAHLPIYNELEEKDFSGAVYFFLNSVFNADELDTKHLLHFVEKGNTAFISANYFSKKFSDTLKISTDDFFDYGKNMPDTGLYNGFALFTDTVRLNFVNPQLKEKKDFVFPKAVPNFHITELDTSKTTVLGKNSYGQVNFIRMRWGKGNIFIHTLPQVFTNYCFVSPINCHYAYKALSYLPNTVIIWDEYYKMANQNTQGSPLRFIFNNPPLYMAYLLSIGAFVLFLIFGIKRKQRIIPLLESFHNTSLEFVNIIGTLYYQQGIHKNLSDKKITYFLEYVRSTFFVKTIVFDDRFISKVSYLSGVRHDEVKDLFGFIAIMQLKQTVTQEEILKLNLMIEKFKKRNKR